ncbi:helix-turn-helix transcriptional regulator [bacterium]|nr:helix-turn-helix transcriptional regulator [bacterium]
MFLEKKFIGQKFKEYRKKLGFSQEKLAEKAELALKHYGRLERGDCIPTLLTFFKLIEILEIPMSEFGIDIENIENENRNKLIREIYLSDTKEIDAFLNIIKTIKALKFN